MSVPSNQGSYDRADAFVTELLARLGAEDEWITSSETALTWCAGPAATMFRILPSVTSHLVALILESYIGYVDDLSAGQSIVEAGNSRCDSFQWLLVADPKRHGLAHVAEAHPNSGQWAQEIYPNFGEDGRPFILLSSTFVFGDPTIEVPIDVMELIAREQIAKANVLVTNWDDGFPEVGESIIGGGRDGTVRDSDWNEVVWHYDNHVTPVRDSLSPNQVLLAIRDAHVRSIDRLESSGQAAWFGANSLQWEVPFDAGPFAVVSSTAMPHLENQSTSFVQAHPRGGASAFPTYGSGVHLVMRLGDRPRNPLTPEEVASILNLQRHFPTARTSPVTCHGLGSWTVMNDEVVWAMFIPAYWAESLTDDVLAIFLDEVLENTARLSWASRPALAIAAWDEQPQPGGLATGGAARGETFGEPRFET